MSNEGQQLRDALPLFVGDLYEGAYGPTIILIASRPVACVWLQNIFRELAGGGPGRTLTAEPEMRIINVDALKVACRPDGPRVTLSYDEDANEKSFVWSATAEGWLYLADLMQPLVDGKTGHQYLTEGKDDVALIELSFGEQDVLNAARAAREGNN